jgi:hypothetical protein
MTNHLVKFFCFSACFSAACIIKAVKSRDSFSSQLPTSSELLFKSEITRKDEIARECAIANVAAEVYLAKLLFCAEWFSGVEEPGLGGLRGVVSPRRPTRSNSATSSNSSVRSKGKGKDRVKDDIVSQDGNELKKVLKLSKKCQLSRRETPGASSSSTPFPLIMPSVASESYIESSVPSRAQSLCSSRSMSFSAPLPMTPKGQPVLPPAQPVWTPGSLDSVYSVADEFFGYAHSFSSQGFSGGDSE